MYSPGCEEKKKFCVKRELVGGVVGGGWGWCGGGGGGGGGAGGRGGGSAPAGIG